MIGDKRKADVLGENLTQGKRTAIFAHGHESAHDNAPSPTQRTTGSHGTNSSELWAQHQTLTPPISPLEDDDGLSSDIDVKMTDSDSDSDSNSPSIENLQRSIHNVYNHHIHLFGPAHRTKIKDAHQKLMSNSDYDTMLAASEAFVASLRDYVQDLQQAAIQQTQWRASMRNIGASKEVSSATDTILSHLDAQIISIGADAENLMQEILMLRGHDQALLVS